MRIVAVNAAPASDSHVSDSHVKNFCSGVIVTSAHALELLPDVFIKDLRARPLHVVGARTAQIAGALGFNDVRSASRDASELAKIILASAAPRSHFLYLAGRDRQSRLERALSNADHVVETIVVYEAQAESALTATAIDALRAKSIDAVLHFSPRSAALLVELAMQAGVAPELNRIAHICISAAAAKPLAGCATTIRIAASPDAAGLFSALKTV